MLVMSCTQVMSSFEGFDALGEVMKPMATAQPSAIQQQQANQKLIQAGNLDGSLSSLASNLNINSHNISRYLKCLSTIIYICFRLDHSKRMTVFGSSRDLSFS